MSCHNGETWWQRNGASVGIFMFVVFLCLFVYKEYSMKAEWKANYETCMSGMRAETWDYADAVCERKANRIIYLKKKFY